jgi:hypothetical protein
METTGQIDTRSLTWIDIFGAYGKLPYFHFNHFIRANIFGDGYNKYAVGISGGDTIPSYYLLLAKIFSGKAPSHPTPRSEPHIRRIK